MLTNTEVEKLTITKGKNHPDRDGLYLYITESGAKSWRWDYRWPRTATGRRQRMTYGTFPDVSLAGAREKHGAARKLLVAGINPAQQKREQRQQEKVSADNTFKTVAERWYSAKVEGRSKSWRSNVRRWLDLVYKSVGSRPITEISNAEILGILRVVEEAGKAVSANAIRKVVSQVYDYANANLLIQNGLNPARNLAKALTVPKATSHPHIRTNEIPEFYTALAKDPGDELSKHGARLLFLTFTRIRELLSAEWAEVDLDRATWEIPAKRMKNGLAHIVPLSTRAVEEFRTIKAITGEGKYIFPNRRGKDKPMVPATLNGMFCRMGFKDRLSPHGIRSTASTALNEIGFRADVIERQLAHVEVNKVRGVYNRADYMNERRQMMTAWADLIDRLREGKDPAQMGNVIPLISKAA